MLFVKRYGPLCTSDELTALWVCLSTWVFLVSKNLTLSVELGLGAGRFFPTALDLLATSKCQSNLCLMLW